MLTTGILLLFDYYLCALNISFELCSRTFCCCVFVVQFVVVCLWCLYSREYRYSCRGVVVARYWKGGAGILFPLFYYSWIEKLCRRTTLLWFCNTRVEVFCHLLYFLGVDFGTIFWLTLDLENLLCFVEVDGYSAA